MAVSMRHIANVEDAKETMKKKGRRKEKAKEMICKRKRAKTREGTKTIKGTEPTSKK